MMAMPVAEPNGDFSHIRIRANNQALENKRRNEMVNEILRPPPQPLTGEEPPAHQAALLTVAEPDLLDDGKRGKATNPFGSETAEQKAARQQREAEEDIRRYKEERRRQTLQQDMEKKRDMQMLQTYYPWGRPGHGAPLGPEQEAMRKHKFLSNGQEGQELGDHEEGLPLNRPGHGAPIRTQSGRLLTQLPGDPDLRFRRDRPGRDPAETLRYKNPDGETYARELDLHMQQQMQQREMQRAYELQEELDSLQYDPYGKPGSGAPNPPQQQLQQHQQQQWRQQQRLGPDGDPLGQHYDPWGKGFGTPPGDQDGSRGTMRQQLHELTQPTSDHQWSQSQRRDPYDTQSAPNQRAALPPLQQAQQQQQAQAYNPFGRPGAGAPLRDREGQVISSVYGATAKFDETPGDKQKRAEAARMYSQELERGLIEQSLSKRLEIQQRRAPVDSPIADQLARGTVGKPPRDPRTGVLLDQHLPSSDVTHINYKTPRHKFKSVTGSQHLPDFVQTAVGYGSELERAAGERAVARRLDRMREMHEASQHAQAFDRMFGRPGAGAPRERTKKVNLDMALHNPDGVRNDYKNPVDHGSHIRSTSYVRHRTGSSHGNGYEVPNDGLTTTQPPYGLSAPYAMQRQN